MRSAAVGLRCGGCGATYELGPHWWGCGRCVDAGGFPHWLDVEYDLTAVDHAPLQRVGRVWDYGALLPFSDVDPPTLGEGGTPLLCIEELNREVGVPNLHLKLEAGNPTGSFKDRYQTVAMAAARALGFKRAVLTTTGNAGVAAAAMAARAGLDLLIITDPLSTPEQRRLMGLFGATITAPTRPGPVITNAAALKDALVRDHDFYPATVQGTYAGPGNPYGVEGYKTIAFEVVAQLGRAPDRFCTPTAGGDSLHGPFRGFTQLRALGVTDALPKMTACQAGGAAFLVESIARDLPQVATVTPQTLALSIADPTGSQSALDAIRSSQGDAWAADDDDLLATVALLGRHGICVEAASAAPVAALRRRAAEGLVETDELVVAVLTGSGSKWVAQVDAATGGPPDLVQDDIDTILAAMEAST